MSQYERVNLFVGKYKVPEDGHIRLPNAKIRILWGVVDTHGWREASDGEPWLIIEDGDFWPVMVRLGSADLQKENERLRESLTRVSSFVGYRPYNVVQRFIKEVLNG